MHIRFLGTGTSLGVPQPACNCAVCRSTDSRDTRLRSSLLVSQGDVTVLIDAGPDLRAQMLRHRVQHVSHLLLTHSHYDHVGGIDDLRPYCFASPGGTLPVYCTPGVADNLRSRLPYCFRTTPSLSAVPHFDLRPISYGEPFRIGELEVLPLKVLHGPSEQNTIAAYRIGQLGYVTDAKTVPDETIEALRGVDVLVLNALRHTPHPTHMSLCEALNIARRIGAPRTLITHMSHAIGLHADLLSLLPAGVEPAVDGQSILL